MELLVLADPLYFNLLIPWNKLSRLINLFVTSDSQNFGFCPFTKNTRFVKNGKNDSVSLNRHEIKDNVSGWLTNSFLLRWYNGLSSSLIGKKRILLAWEGKMAEISLILVRIRREFIFLRMKEFNKTTLEVVKILLLKSPKSRKIAGWLM